MKKVVSFSGGRTSAYLLWLLKDDPQAEFIFCDTGAEHPATYDFIKNIVREWNIQITFLCAKISPWLGEGIGFNVLDISELGGSLDIFSAVFEKYGTPYTGGAFCTDRLKLQPFKKYCDHVFGKDRYETWLGIRADEPSRIKEKEGIRYLAEISDFDKQDVLDWWSEQNFDLGIDEHLGNCLFCIKKSVNKLALAARDEPEMANKWIGLIESEGTRNVETRTTPSNIMYRGKNSLSSIIAKFEPYTGQEIRETIRSMKRKESGGCSESCEIFQLDLF